MTRYVATMQKATLLMSLCDKEDCDVMKHFSYFHTTLAALKVF